MRGARASRELCGIPRWRCRAAGVGRLCFELRGRPGGLGIVPRASESARRPPGGPREASDASRYPSEANFWVFGACRVASEADPEASETDCEAQRPSRKPPRPSRKPHRPSRKPHRPSRKPHRRGREAHRRRRRPRTTRRKPRRCRPRAGGTSRRSRGARARPDPPPQHSRRPKRPAPSTGRTGCPRQRTGASQEECPRPKIRTDSQIA